MEGHVTESTAMPAGTRHPGARVAWRDGLLARLTALGPGVGDRFLTTAPASADAMPATRLQDLARLRAAIIDCGESQFGMLSVDGETDAAHDWKPAAAASRFTRHYLGSLTALAVVALANGVGLDLAPARCVKLVEHGLPRRQLLADPEDGVVTCAERPPAWAVGGETVPTVDDLRRRVWGQLYGAHLAPLFAAVNEVTGASANLLWSNAAEWADYIADVAVWHLAPEDAAPIVAESEALFDAETLPGVAGPNPLKGLVRRDPVDGPDFPRGIQLRRHCCITYQLPSRTGRLCFNCPFLPLDERIALARETQGPAPSSGGPAELRSMAIGRGKIRPKR